LLLINVQFCTIHTACACTFDLPAPPKKPLQSCCKIRAMKKVSNCSTSAPGLESERELSYGRSILAVFSESKSRRAPICRPRCCLFRSLSCRPRKSATRSSATSIVRYAEQSGSAPQRTAVMSAFRLGHPTPPSPRQRLSAPPARAARQRLPPWAWAAAPSARPSRPAAATPPGLRFVIERSPGGFLAGTGNRQENLRRRADEAA
jgi:hypothetical protein